MGENVCGIGVRIAAGVQAAADPGQVLVSSTVVGSGLRFADHGEHELKGAPVVLRLHAATGDARAAHRPGGVLRGYGPCAG